MIEISGLKITLEKIPLEDSTDTADILEISDGKNKVHIEVCFGKITQIKVNEKICSCKHK